MSLEMLPQFEMYEEGSQIRRAIKSVRANIVEGYGRRRYVNDYIRFLTYAQASCDEALDHLCILRETGSLQDDEEFESIREELDELGRKLNRFIQSIDRARANFVREQRLTYDSEHIDVEFTRNLHRETRDEKRET
jgi:four helix bundle protein